MIDTGTAIIVGSLLSLLGAIVIIQLNNSNWFKRENFRSHSNDYWCIMHYHILKEKASKTN